MYLKLMKMDPQLYNFNATGNAEFLISKHLRDLKSTDDMQAISDILEKNKVIVVDDGTNPRRKRKGVRGEQGINPIYDYIKNVYDHVIGSKEGNRVLDADRVTQKQIKAIENALRRHDFQAITKPGGIERLSHIDDIFYAAADGKMRKLIDTHVDASIAIYNHLAGEGRGVTRSVEKNTLTRLYNIISDPLGNKIKYENDLLLDRYRRILNAFGGRYIHVDRNANTRLKVTNEKFKGLKELIDGYEHEINKIIYGDEIQSHATRANELAKEGFLYELMVGQDFHKGIRDTYTKLNDLRNSKELWHFDEKNKVHDGSQLGDLISKLFWSDNDRLFTSLEFGRNVPAELRQMATLFHEILYSDPNSKAVLFKDVGEVGKITDINSLRLVRNILYRNGMKGFLLEDRANQQLFIDEYIRHSQERFTHSAVKRDGKPLNHMDRQAVGELLDYRLLGPNYQLVDVLGVINHLEQVVNMENIKLNADGKLVDKRTNKLFKLRENMFAKHDTPETLKDFIRETSNETGIVPTEQLELILKSYKSFIEPFLVDGQGNGFIKPSGVVAQLNQGHIMNLVNRLDTIYKSREQQFHDNLMEKLEMVKGGQDFNRADREKLDYLYYLYSTGKHSTSKIIKALDDRKLYDFKNDVTKIEPTDKALGEKLQEIIAEVTWDIAASSDATKIENNINTYRSGRDSKITEVEIYRTATKQTLIKDYNLDKDVDFKKDNVVDIIDTAYIVKGGEKHYFNEAKANEAKGDGIMNYKEKEKFIAEIGKVIGATTETRTLRRLFGTEGYGIHTQFDYQVYNNHFFDFLDIAVGLDKWAVVDYDLQRVNNRMESARIVDSAKIVLSNLLHDTQLFIDQKYRPNEHGKLDYELRTHGSLLIEVPGLNHAIAIGKESLPKFLEITRQKIDSFKEKYTEGKYKPLLKEIEAHFNNIAKKVENEREVEIVKEVNGKKVTVTEMEKYETWEYKEQDHLKAGLSLESLLHTMALDNFMGPLYWKELAINASGDPVSGAKLLRRVKLFANQSMRRQSEDQLDIMMGLYKKYLDPKDSQYKALQSMKKNGGLRIVIAEDENFGVDGRQFSLIKDLQTQLKEAIGNARDKEKIALEEAEKLIKPDGKGGLTYADGGDISKVDSYMAVSPKAMEALYTLNGASYMTGLGGIKPIVHRVGDAIILGKTAFIVAPEMQGFFKKNGVDAVLFNSGAKMTADKTKVLTEFDSMDSFMKLDRSTIDNYREVLKLEDISLGAIVAPEHNATLSYQITNNLSGRESKEMFNWLLADKLDNLNKDQNYLFTKGQELSALSRAKFWSEKNAEIDPNSLYSRWINHNGFINSQLVLPDFISQVKSRMIDKGGIMKLETPYGNQSVNAPGEGLKFTLFGREGDANSIYQYGQADLPYVAGNKLISLNRFHLIDRRADTADKVILGKDIKGQDVEIYNVLDNVKMYKDPTMISKDLKKRDVWVVPTRAAANKQLAEIKKGSGKGKNFKTIKKKSDGYYILEHTKGDNKHIYIEGSKAHNAIANRLELDQSKISGQMYKKELTFKEGMTLKEAYNVLQDINTQSNTNYEIAVTFKRNPQTRPGDIAIVGIRNILGNEYGNQVRLNALDFALRLEGDFDIDKTDFWWDTPTNILNKWSKLSGEVLRVNPDGVAKKTSLTTKSAAGLDSPLKLTDPASVREWDRHLAESEKLRGTVIKTQRLLQALEHYSSFENVLRDTNGKALNGFAIDLQGYNAGGKLYIDPGKLKKARKVLAYDIQNITDSLTGFDHTRYNQKWFENFLFGDGKIGNYEGIFAKASKDKESHKWEIGGDTVWNPSKLERAIVMEALQPYRAMLQLGTQIYSRGKPEQVRYEDILSQMKDFDAVFSDLSKHVYTKLKRTIKKQKFSLTDLEGYFKDKDGNMRNVYGEFGNLMRPNLFGTRKGQSVSLFQDMLPFERTMSVLAFNDNMSVAAPHQLRGEMLQKYHDFYSKYMYSENFNEMAGEFINRINKNDKNFGYVNWLDWRIKQQNIALRNAYVNKQNWLVDSIKESIQNLKEQKDMIEKELLYNEKSEGNIYAKKLRDGAISSVINQVYKGKMLPPNWNKHAGTKKKPLTKDQTHRRFDDAAQVSAFVSNNFVQFVNYVKNSKVIRLKGVHSADQLELMIWNNMLEKFKNVGIRDELTGQENLDMDVDVQAVKKYRATTWKEHFSGHDWTMDHKQANQLIHEMLETQFKKWQDKAGAGQLFIWKLIAPAVDPYHFTYYNGRITPGFKNDSLSLLKVGMRFLNNTNQITDFQKSNLFSYMTSWYNNSYRAANGMPGEAGNFVYRQMSNMSNMRTDIFKGAPLVDDIRGWQPGMQETELNPRLRHLFADDPRSLIGAMSTQVVDPSIINYATSLATWSYSPLSYIPENIGMMNYPSINGYKNYRDVVRDNSNILLGSSIQQRLLFRKGPIIEKNAFENIQPNEATGAESFNQKIDAKTKVFC